MASNVFSNAIEKIEICKKRYNEIDRPNIIIGIYNKYKGGVDFSYQMIAEYEFDRKLYKWKKRTFYHLLDIAVVNPFIIYKHHHKNISQFEYRMMLVKELIQEDNEYRKRVFVLGKNQKKIRFAFHKNALFSPSVEWIMKIEHIQVTVAAYAKFLYA